MSVEMIADLWIMRQCVYCQVCNGSRDEPYHNPRAPVHIVTGSAVRSTLDTTQHSLGYNYYHGRMNSWT